MGDAEGMGEGEACGFIEDAEGGGEGVGEDGGGGVRGFARECAAINQGSGGNSS